jgi:anti-sigma factor RsiW
MITNHFDEDQLIAYADGRLMAEARAAMDSHLGECAVCQAELLAVQQTLTTLSEAARELQRMPAHTHRGWAQVRQRLHTPLVVRVRQASGRFSLQAMMSLSVVVMLFLSGMSINLARASSPTLPYIQTPGTALQVVVTDDTPTLSVTEALETSHTPTLTLTPVPDINN